MDTTKLERLSEKRNIFKVRKADLPKSSDDFALWIGFEYQEFDLVPDDLFLCVQVNSEGTVLVSDKMIFLG